MKILAAWIFRFPILFTLSRSSFI